MRVLLTIILVATFYVCSGQTKDAWKGKPNSIEECFQHLDKIFDDTAGYTFTTLPEDIATSRLHHGFGTWMRNNWGLWGSGKLKNELIDSGFVHPDDMSSILLKAYHRRLNGKPLNLKDDAKAYQAYWNKIGGDGFSAGDLGGDHKKHTTIDELLEYFPVGDTILVSVFATQKKLFREYASSAKGIAVIQSHSAEKLTIKLLSIEQKKKHEPEREVGEEYEISPIYCSLIPPIGWTIK